MKSKLYKHYRKPSYFHLRKMGYISFSITILMMGILIPLSLISVGAYQQSSSTSETSEMSESTSIIETTSEDVSSEVESSEEKPPFIIYPGQDSTAKVWLWK